MTSKIVRIASMFTVLLVLGSCNGGASKVNGTGEQVKEAVPFIDVTSPADGALLSEGESINLKFSLPKEVSKCDSVIILFNDKVIAKGSISEASIPTKGLKMGSQNIWIRAYTSGKVAAEKYMSVNIKSASEPTQYSYNVVKTYPHDTHAYTQGLTFDNNTLYEGTGQRGESQLKIVDLNTGNATKNIHLDDSYFGEGIAIIGDKIFQLTWQEQRGFVYNKKTLEKIRDFMYPGEGWGLTTDGKVLFLSDGSKVVRILDPEKLVETGRIEVYDNKAAVTYINEMEYINGEIWANIYMTDKIVRFEPTTGKVLGYIDFKGLLADSDKTANTDVLNGIAYNPNNGKIYVTGKYWPKMFEVKIVKK